MQMYYSYIQFVGKHKNQVDVENFQDINLTDHNIMFWCENPWKLNLFDSCLVYGICTDKFLKIGHSRKFVSRFNSLQCANPEKLRVSFIFPVPYASGETIEKSLHNALRKYRVNREWFDIKALDDDYLCKKLDRLKNGRIIFV